MSGKPRDPLIALAQVSCCLEAIAGADQKPGHVAYMTKAEMAACAGRALTILESALGDLKADEKAKGGAA